MNKDTVNARYEAMKARDRKRMTLAELREFSALLDEVKAEVEQAIKYEQTSAKHPVALTHEERAEERFDAALLYFATVRLRADEL